MKRIKRATEPGHLYLFTMPPVDREGFDVRELVMDCGGVEGVADKFGLTTELVNLWISGRQPPPKYFLIALWWQSWRGFDQGFVETHYANQRNYRELCNAEKRIERLEQAVAYAISQGVDLKHLADPSAPGRDLVQSEKRVRLLEQVVHRALEHLGDNGRYLRSIAFTGQ